jgi:hypothetical protein
MEQLIRQVIATLDTVEVKGRDNLDKVLGCMQALEKIADAMRHNRETMNKTTQEGEKQDVSGGI